MKHIHSLIAFVMLAITTISFASCSSEDESEGGGSQKLPDVTLNSGQTKIMEGTKSFTWKSSNEQIAILRNDTLYGRCAGIATLTSKGGSFKVKVEAKSNFIKEPYLEFGASQSTVKNWMKSNIPNAILHIDEGDPELLGYECPQDEGAVLVYMYGHYAHNDYKQGQLTSAQMIIKPNYKDELIEFLKERYVIVENGLQNQHQYIVMTSPEVDMAVMLQIDANMPFFVLSYAPHQSKNRSAINSDLFKSLLKPTSKTPESEAAFKNLVNSIKAAQ